MKTSKLGKTNFSSIALALVFALTSQMMSNLAYAGAGWGDNIDITGTPIKVQTFYANSPTGMRPDPLGGPDINTGTAMRKFVDTLPSVPGLAPSTNAGVNNLGQYLPLAVPEKWVNMNGDLTTDDYYEIAVVDYTERVHSDLAKATRFRGYVQLSTAAHPGQHLPLNYPDGSPVLDLNGNQVYTYDKPHYLGPIIVANRGTAVRIKYTNYLPLGTNPGNSGELFIPVDRTLPGAGFGADGVTQFPDNRVDIHWHGGDTPWISDGTPHQWIAPANNAVPGMERGESAENVPDMPDPGPGSGTLYFPNNLSGRFMFYHDHTSGITRLNVYVGMAAGYLINDPVEQILAGAPANPALYPGVTSGVVPAEQIPLVIQDRTFVPKDIALQDAKWDSNHWGKEGDLWFPHVYETNQDPNAFDGTNPVGRWDWGPWFWPIFPSQYSLPSGEYGDVSTTPEAFMDTPVINGTAYPTLTVDPKAYRFRILNAGNDRFLNLGLYQAVDANGELCDLNTNPNPAPEASGVACTEVKMVPGVSHPNDPNWPSTWPTEDRVGGVPDFYTSGPDIISIGSEGGILPHPAVIRSQPINYEWNRRSITVLNVLDHGLFMGNAERADVIVDFSQFAGKTLILHNDAPAPVPAVDPRVDYFTGNEDLSGSGGAYTTKAGYGPNTRTMLQIKVTNTTPAPAFDLPALEAALPAAYGLTQDRPIIPQVAYNQAFGTNDADNLAHIFTGSLNQQTFEWTPTLAGQTVTEIQLVGGGSGYQFAPIVNFNGGVDLNVPGNRAATALATIDPVLRRVTGIKLLDGGVGYTAAPVITFTPVKGGVGASANAKLTNTQSLPVLSKAIHELFEPFYGRMNAILAMELPFTSALIQTTIPLNYVDPATEEIADGETQIWKVTHNGVDTHPIHFHLVNIQVLNRVGWDGTVKPISEDEFGWKETLKFHPLEDVIVAVRAKRPEVPFGQPQSVRPMDPSQPLGSTLGFSQVDPFTNNPKTVSNQIVNLDNEYVWHCHILGHEENDFMRPIIFHPNVTAPNAITDLAVSGNTLTWTDPTPALAPTTLNNTQNEIGYRIMRSVNGGAYAQVGTSRANTTGWDGSLENPPVSVAAPEGSNYTYRVDIYNVAATVPSNAATIATAPGAPAGLTATVSGATSVKLDWVASLNSAAQQVWRCAGTGCTTFAQVGADLATATSTFTDTGLTANTTYVYMIKAVAAPLSGLPAADSASIEITAGIPSVPTTVSASSVAGGFDPQATVTWMDTANNETTFEVGRKIGAGACLPSGYISLNAAIPASVPANATGTQSFVDATAAFGATYCYEVRATNAAGSSVYAITPTAVSMAAGVGAPTNVAAVADAIANNVTLTWTDNSITETAFQVRVSTDGGTSWTVLSATEPASVGTGTVKTFVHTNATAALPLAANTSYIYEVTAGDGVTSSLPVTAAAATTVVMPAAPTGLGATVTSATSMDLTWMDMASNEEGYLLETAVVTAGVPGAYTTVGAPIASIAGQIAQINRVMNYNVVMASATTYALRVTAYSTQFGVAANASTQIIVTADVPATPTNSLPGFTTNASGSQVDLVWQDNADNETTYRVERATYAADGITLGAYTTLANIARSAAEKAASGVLSVVSYSDTTTAALTKYSYMITARNYAASAPLMVDADLALPLAPLAPTSLNVAVLSATEVDLSWTDNSIDETGYRVEVSINNGAFITAAMVNGTVDQSLNVGLRHYSPDYSATNIKVAAGNTYVYRITSFRTQFGYTNYSAGATSALVDISIPAAPTAGSATAGVGGTSVALVWNDNAANETGYEVEVAANGGAYAPLASLAADNAAYSDVTTAAGNTYSYRVTAVNVNGGATMTSAPASFAVDMTAPAAPTALAAAANTAGTQVTLSWTDVASNETHYQVERAPVVNNVVGAYGSADVIAHTLTNGAVNYIDPVATVPGSQYSYRVTALNVSGAVTMASVQVETLVDLTPPPAPADPTGLAYSVINGTTVDLSWTDVATTETAYSVEVETDGVGGFVALPDLAADSASYTATVAVGHTYKFQVRALTTHLGSTTYSNYSSIVSLNMAVPAAPSALAATPAIDGTSVDLSWTDLADNETGYLVEVSTNDGATYTSLTTVARNATESANVNVAPVTYTHTPTVPNTKYTYRVSAVNEVATTTVPVQIFSTATTVVADMSAPDAPVAPTLLVASVANATTVQLNWVDNTVSGPDQLGDNGYIVEVETDGVGGFVAQPALVAHSNTATVAALVGHTYRYQVRAYNTNLGSTVYSTYVGPASINMAAPVAPVAVSATPNLGGTQVLLSWTDAANNETEYQITTSINGVHVPALDATVARTAAQSAANGGAVFYSAVTTPATPAIPANVYSYEVIAVNQAGATVSVPSATSITLTADLSAPAAPTAPTVLTTNVLSTTSLQLGWTDNATTETGYSVEVSTNGGPFVAQPALAADATGTLVTVAVGNTYSFQVRALTTALGSTTHSTYVGPVAVNMALPAAPTAPTATRAVSGTTVDLSWTDIANNETGFLIEVSTDGVNYSTLATVAHTAGDAAVVNYTATSTLGVVNTYRITAQNTVGAITVSSATSITVAADLTAPAAPAAPSALTTNVLSATSLQLGWTDNATTETGYSVEISTNGGPFVAEAEIAANSTSYLTTVAVGNTYSYQVRALTLSFGSTTHSAYAAPVAVDLTAPAAPTAPSAVAAVSGTTVDLSWTDVATNETGYLVEGSTDGVNYSTLATVAHTAGDAATVNYTAASTPGAVNTYRITTVNTAGAVTVPSATSITVAADLTAPAAPTAPTALTTDVLSATSLQLGWTDNATTETGYSVEVSTNGGPFVAQPELAANSTGTLVTVSVGYTYSFQVRALTLALGSTTHSTYVGPVTVNMAVPAAPTALVATPAVSGASVNLTWTDNASNETGYLVEVSTDDGASYLTLTTVARNAAESSAVGGTASFNAFAIAGIKYQYRVTALNAVGAVTVPSSSITAIADLSAPAAPAAPTSLAVNASSNTVATLSWTDNVSNETGYRVDVSTDGGSTYTQLTDLVSSPAQSSATGTMAYFATVAVGNNYKYRVYAYRTVLGSTTPSGYAGPVGLNLVVPAAPTALAATPAVSGTTAALSWTDNASNESGYLVEVSTDGTNYSALTTLARNAAESAATLGTVNYTATSTPGVINTYRVSALNVTGPVSLASTAATVAVDLSAPAAPIAPTGLAANAVSPTSVLLTWAENATGETGYNVEVSTNGGAYVALPALPANSSSYAAVVAVGNTYSFQVSAFKTVLGTTTHSGYAGPVGVDMTAPAAPTALVATPAVNGATVALSWTDAASNETDYLVEVSTDGGATYGVVATLPAGSVGHTATTTPGTSYMYRVTARNVVYAVTIPSASATVAADLSAPAAPAAPTVLTTSVLSTTSLQLGWTDNATTETGYSVEVSTNGGAYVALPELAANSTGYTATIAVGNTYSFQVRALTSNLGSTTPSTYLGPVAVDMNLPAAPSGIGATLNTATTALVFWTDNATTETGYLVEVSADGGATFGAPSLNRPANSTGAVVPVTLGNNYVFRVSATKTVYGLTLSSSSVSSGVVAANPPAAPINLTATPAPGFASVSLVWQDNSNSEKSFLVEVSTDGVNYSTLTSVTRNSVQGPAMGDFLSYTAPTLLSVNYTYRVSAVNVMGASAPVSAAVDLTPQVAPATPSGITTVLNTGSTSLVYWTDNANDEAGYLLEQSTDSGATWSTTVNLVRNAAQSSSTGAVVGYYAPITLGKNYIYRVSAHKTIYGITYTSPAAISGVLYATIPAGPTNLGTLPGAGGTQVTLWWTDNANNEAAYLVEVSIDGGANYSTLTSVSRNSVEAMSVGAVLYYLHTPTTPGTTYTYRVRALNVMSLSAAGITTATP